MKKTSYHILKKTGITFQKTGKAYKKRNHISKNSYHISKKSIKFLKTCIKFPKTGITIKKNDFAFPKDRLRNLPKKKGQIRNSKNMGGLSNASRYKIKHNIKVLFDKNRVPLMNFSTKYQNLYCYC